MGNALSGGSQQDMARALDSIRFVDNFWNSRRTFRSDDFGECGRSKASWRGTATGWQEQVSSKGPPDRERSHQNNWFVREDLLLRRCLGHLAYFPLTLLGNAAGQRNLAEQSQLAVKNQP